MTPDTIAFTLYTQETIRPPECGAHYCTRTAEWIGLMECGCTVPGCTPCKEEVHDWEVRNLPSGVLTCLYCNAIGHSPTLWERI